MMHGASWILSEAETGDEVTSTYLKTMGYRSYILQDVHSWNPAPDNAGITISTLTGLTRVRPSQMPLGTYCSGVCRTGSITKEPRSFGNQELKKTAPLSGYLCVQSGLLQGDGFLGLATSIKSEPLQERRENEDQTRSAYCQTKTG